MRKTVTFFTHKSIEGPARLIDVFDQAEFDQTHIFTPEVDLKDFDVLQPDLLVVMGGPMGTYETQDHPYLVEEVRIIRQRIKAKKPVLGICLGGQLIAEALGAKCYKADRGLEIGWAPLTVNDAGKETPVKHLDGAFTNMFHYHQDTFKLPEGATLLASSEMFENQIFSYGENIMALQCHPEVEEKQLDGWLDEFFDKENGAKIARETPGFMPGMNRQCRLFVNEWLDSVGLKS